MNGSSSEALDLMEWFCGSPKTRRVPQEAVLRFRRCVRYTRRSFLRAYDLSIIDALRAGDAGSGGCYTIPMGLCYGKRDTGTAGRAGTAAPG